MNKKPYINVITADLGGDGHYSNTYSVTDVFRTSKIKVGQEFTYPQLLSLSKNGIDFEILDEYDYSDVD